MPANESYWQRSTDSHVYRQPLDVIGAFLYHTCLAHSTNEREHWCVVLKCTLEHRIEEDEFIERLKAAWVVLRFEQPALAAKIDPATKDQVYEIPKSQNVVDDWVAETLIIDTGTTTFEEKFADLKYLDMPTLYYFTRTGQIMMQLNHWRIEARGTLMLLSRLLQHLANNTYSSNAWGQEASRLPASIEQIFDVPIEPTATATKYAKDRVSELISAMPPTGLTFKGDLNTQPSTFGRYTLDMSLETTDAIIKACKKRSITVTSAFQAGTVLYNFQHAAPGRENFNCVQLVSRDLRRDLPRPFNTDLNAVHAYIAGQFCISGPPKDFMAAAQNMQKQLKGFDTPGYFAAMREIGVYLGAAASAPPPPGTPPPCDLGLNSVGVMEKILQHTYGHGNDAIILKDPAVMATVASRQLTMHVWTWDDRIRTSLQYNTAYHDEQTMKQVLPEVIMNVAEGLDVKLDPM